MTNFEDEVFSQVNNVKEEATALQSEQETRQADTDRRHAEESQRHSRALNLGIQVAGLLATHNVPTQDIWEDVKIGASEPHLRSSKGGGYYARTQYTEKQITGHGWHLLTEQSVSQDSSGEIAGYANKKHYAIDTEGRLLAFDQLNYEGHARFLGPQKKSEQPIVKIHNSIITPQELQSADLVILTNRKEFRKSIASLIANLGPYKWINETSYSYND